MIEVHGLTPQVLHDMWIYFGGMFSGFCCGVLFSVGIHIYTYLKNDDL